MGGAADKGWLPLFPLASLFFIWALHLCVSNTESSPKSWALSRSQKVTSKSVGNFSRLYWWRSCETKSKLICMVTSHPVVYYD